MSDFYNRAWAVYLDDKLFIKNSGAFAITMQANVVSALDAMNQITLKLYGIDAETMKTFKHGQKLRFDAGYEDSIGTIFTGVITVIESGIEPPNTFVLIMGSSFKFGRLENPKRYNKNFAAETPLVAIQENIAEFMGYTYENVNIPETIKIGKRPLTITGRPLSQLKKLNNSFNKISEMTEEPYKVGVTILITSMKGIDLNKESDKGVSTWEVNSSTGLLSVPRYRFIQQVSFKTALRPEIKVTDKINLKSYYWNYTDKNDPFLKTKQKTVDDTGSYFVWSVNRTCHTNGEWNQTIEGWPINLGKLK